MLARLRHLSGGQMVLIAIVLVVVVGLIIQANDHPSPRSGGGGDGGGTSQADSYFADYGGSLAVYQQILTDTSCASLQTTFDRAGDNHDTAEPGSPEAQWTTGYMVAADTRMQKIGCY